jgi:hypothetical protein
MTPLPPQNAVYYGLRNIFDAFRDGMGQGGVQNSEHLQVYWLFRKKNLSTMVKRNIFMKIGSSTT